MPNNRVNGSLTNSWKVDILTPYFQLVKMDILKQSESFAARISNVGEQFRLNLLMGELAYSTFDDFFELGDVIQASIDYWEAEGRSEEQIAELLCQDDKVLSALEQVFARMVMTADQYGYLNDEPRETAQEYCRAAGKALKDLEVICQDLGLEEIFQEQLSYYGSGAKNHLQFSERLERVYENRYTAPVNNLIPGEKRLRTADYSDALQPREYVARAVFHKEKPQTGTKTLPGVLMDQADFDPPKTQSDLEMPLVRVSETPVNVSAQLPLRHDTEIGLGALANQMALGTANVDIPPHSPLPEIAADAVLEAPPAVEKFDDLEENTIVSVPEGLEESVPPMPPAPELLEPSAALAEVQGETESMRPSRPPLHLVQPLEDPSLESSLIAAANSLAGQPEPLAEPSQHQAVPSERPLQSSQPEIEVYVSQKQSGPRAMAPTEPDPLPAVKTDSEIPQQEVKRVVLDPIAPPEDLVLPSSYRPGPTSQPSRRPEVIREDQAFENERPENPAQVRRKTRSGIWKWAAAATAAAGLAGLLGGLLSDGEDRTEGAEQRAAAASVGSGGVAGNTATQAPAAAARQAEKPAETQSGKGIYRVNTSHQAFGDYLCYMKDATGLVSVLKAAASQTRVHFFADPAELESAKGRYNHVLSGTESAAQQRIIVMKALLDVATQKSADNPWLINYFKKQRAELEHFEKTGSWTHKGKSIGADRLFEAVQAPEMLATVPNVIGYAPDVSPATNPAVLKVKAGAPTFYRILQEVGTNMQSATEADRLSPYDDFRSIKEVTCRQVLEAGRASRDRDTRAGISYMHRHWCADECVPNNPLNQVLHAPAIPVRAEIPAAPAATPAPAKVVPPQKVQPSAPAPTHSRLEQPSPWIDKPPAAAPQKKGFFGKAMAGIKSLFGSPRQTAQPSETPATQVAPAAQPEFTKKDIPMYTWKETLKQFFWG